MVQQYEILRRRFFLYLFHLQNAQTKHPPSPGPMVTAAFEIRMTSTAIVKIIGKPILGKFLHFV